MDQQQNHQHQQQQEQEQQQPHLFTPPRPSNGGGIRNGEGPKSSAEKALKTRSAPTTLKELKDKLKQSCVKVLREYRAQTVAANRGLSVKCPTQAELQQLISSQLASVGHEMGVNVQFSNGANDNSNNNGEQIGHPASAAAAAQGGGEERDDFMDDTVEEIKCSLEVSGADYVELMQYMEEQWTRELLSQEEVLLAQYREAILFEEESAAQAAAHIVDNNNNNNIDNNNGDESNSSSTLCPCCLLHPLFKNKSVFFCSCGMRLDLQTDLVSLAQLSHLLGEGFDTHRTTMCGARPFCTVQSSFGPSMLIMLCNHCDFFHVVV